MSQTGLAIALYIASEIARLGVKVSGEEQDQEDHEHQTEQPAEGRISPRGGVRPCREGAEAADQGQDQNDDQDGGEHGHAPSADGCRRVGNAQPKCSFLIEPSPAMK